MILIPLDKAPQHIIHARCAPTSPNVPHNVPQGILQYISIAKVPSAYECNELIRAHLYYGALGGFQDQMSVQFSCGFASDYVNPKWHLDTE